MHYSTLVRTFFGSHCLLGVAATSGLLLFSCGGSSLDSGAHPAPGGAAGAASKCEPDCRASQSAGGTAAVTSNDPRALAGSGGTDLTTIAGAGGGDLPSVAGAGGADSANIGGTGGSAGATSPEPGEGGAAGAEPHAGNGGSSGADGQCTAALPLKCGDSLFYSTLTQHRGNVWSAYSSTQRGETGPETLYTFSTARACNVVAHLKDLVADLDLLLLPQCNPLSSTKAASTPLDIQAEETLSWTTQANQNWYVVVDGYANWYGSYTLEIDCTCDDAP